MEAAPSGGAPPPSLEQRGSSQQSLELDILALSQRWEAQRTIRNGDTPGMRKGPRPALAAIPPNVAAAANPFSLTVQRQKTAAARASQPQPQVRFAECASAGRAAAAAAAAADVENGAAPSAAATPATTGVPTTCGRGAATDGGAPSAGPSPSPLVLFRGRLSFAAGEPDSARKFDRPTTARKPAGGGLKRKLLISPGADISAAFPTLVKPGAKQRRRSLSDVGPSWAARAAAAEAEEAAAAADDAAQGSGEDVYWSDPLPVPASASRGRGCADADEVLLDTAASPASSGGGDGCSSPSGSGMDTCCCSPVPAFSPLPGALQHALPTVDHPDCGFPSITPKTMRDLLTHGGAAFGLDRFLVVDCRYDYEYQGGHLPGALHLTTPEAIAGFLAAPRPTPDFWQRTALIFHCEFSTERGPRAAKHVRNKDREAHMHDYPALSYPHVFVLQGGYKAFWKVHAELCEGGYTPMDHPDCSQQLKECHALVKRAWAKTTRTFSRVQQKRRPSYRLRQSSGAGRGGDREGSAADLAAVAAAAAAEVHADGSELPPALVAARHVALMG